MRRGFPIPAAVSALRSPQGLQRSRATHSCVNADLPAATPAAIEELASAGLALVEAADGTTNALSLPDPTVFAPLYGPGSAARFRAHAGFATAAIPELEVDVDTLDDLERLAPRLGRRTRSLLAVPA